MKVLVTGGCGFLGSHVCEYYANKGDTAISYDNMTKYELTRTGYATDESRDYNWNFLKNLGVEMVKGDIRNYEMIRQYAAESDFIVHTAAQPAMTISWEDPDLDFTTNVAGTFNVLKAAREFKIPVVSCSSVHVYGPDVNKSLKEGKTRYLREPSEIDEDHEVVKGELTPLHASKRSAELYVQTFIDMYKVEAASYRLTGLYGPRQFGGEDHGWVANFAIRTVMGKPLRIFGTGKQTRDILYATDAVKAFAAFYHSRKSGIYNIGGSSSTSLSLLECIDLIGEITGEKPQVQFEDERRGDLRYFICDTSKAKKLLQWQATVEPKEGVANLIQWIRDNRMLFKG